MQTSRRNGEFRRLKVVFIPLAIPSTIVYQTRVAETQTSRFFEPLSIPDNFWPSNGCIETIYLDLQWC